MQNCLSNRSWSAALVLVLSQSFSASAAPVVDASSPTQFVATTMAELADVTDIILIGTGIPPGSLVVALRSAPSNEVNAGLDGAQPGMTEGADSLEVGAVPLPAASYSCPSTTPVTITISDWSITLVNASPSAVGAGGGGGALFDSRNASTAAPATAATGNGTSNPAMIGGTNVITQRQFVGTFEDLPFLTFIASINAVRISGGIPVQSYYRAAVPTITLEYDNATCSIGTPPGGSLPVAVPTLSLAHLLLLLLAIPLVARKRRRW